MVATGGLTEDEIAAFQAKAKAARLNRTIGKHSEFNSSGNVVAQCFNQIHG
jgi:hypothetical protein